MQLVYSFKGGPTAFKDAIVTELRRRAANITPTRNSQRENALVMARKAELLSFAEWLEYLTVVEETKDNV